MLCCAAVVIMSLDSAVVGMAECLRGGGGGGRGQWP